MTRLFSLFLTLSIATPVVGTAQQAAEQLLAGNYERAIEDLRRQTARDGATSSAQYTLIQALIETGDYDGAEASAREAIRAGDSGEFQNLLGEVLFTIGRLDEAEAAFRASVDSGARDSLTGRINLGELLLARGEFEEASAIFDSFIDVYNQSPSLSARDLTAVARAVQRLGKTTHVLFKDALKAFDEAIASEPRNLEPRIGVGYLFLEKYVSTEAHQAFGEVLEINPNHPLVHLGIARALEFDGESGAIATANKALEVNPNLVQARIFLARQYLALENLDRAEEETALALEVNPNSLEALSVLAAIRFLQGDQVGYGQLQSQVLNLNPRYADLYVTLADLSVRHRKYEDAVAFAKAATQLDPQSWQGWGLLGLNQLRTGEIEAGIENLETAFEGDPYNVWFKNTLDLTDTFERYEIIETPLFHLVLDSRESDLLAPYVTEVAEEAYEALTVRYGFTPVTPIRVEVFPSHTDFSVRTVGLAGLGALGVSFGPVLAMDSPSARDQGEFNWASTLWHELAHTIHLGLSNHEVPRWFTEGLAVHEQRKARVGWGHNVTVGFLQMYKEGQILPVSELTEGFVRPRYPQQVVHSYYQASLVSQMIEEEHGFQALKSILEGYRDGMTTAEVFTSTLGISMEELDERFEDFLEERFAGPLDAIRRITPGVVAPPSRSALEREVVQRPTDFLARLNLGKLLFEEGETAEALRHLEQALRLFPEYGAPDSPHWYLAQIYEDRGELENAAEALSKLASLNESHYLASMEEAEVMQRLGRPDGAIRALERALYIYPYERHHHALLAELYTETGDFKGAVRERRAILALDPVDRADALYQLALALHQANDDAEARRYVLRALEIAPSFEEALDLLLEIRGIGGNVPEGRR